MRAGRAQLVAESLPKLSIAPPPPGARLDLTGLFPFEASDLWLEIGFGAGEHLLWQAQVHREIGLLGCEPFENGVARLVSDVAASEVQNVRVLADDARLLLAALPAACLGRAFILFPDPWPKARHRRRRIVSRPVLDELARTMRPGAELRLATDHPDYARWMLAHLLAHPAFAWIAERARDWRERPPDWPATRYEAKARAAGRAPWFFTFCRTTAAF